MANANPMVQHENGFESDFSPNPGLHLWVLAFMWLGGQHE